LRAGVATAKGVGLAASRKTARAQQPFESAALQWIFPKPCRVDFKVMPAVVVRGQRIGCGPEK
jgi:hypothetical protein